MANMDTLYTEGELMNPFNDLHHAAYDKVLSFDTTSLSPEATLPARILQLRAQIALGQQSEVLSSTSSEKSTPAIAAVRCLATYTSSQQKSQQEAAVSEAQSLASQHPTDPTVQILAGTVLAAGQKPDEALALLSQHEGSLEAVALIVQIHLMQNRTDLAQREVTSARKWAQDSLLVNIAESWVGLRKGGDKYQQAFYEFEDMPVPQSVAEIHLGRLPEAEAALRKRLEEKEGDAEALANLVVLDKLLGKDVEELKSKLQAAQPKHPMLVDLEEKSDLFDQALAKYETKAAA